MGEVGGEDAGGGEEVNNTIITIYNNAWKFLKKYDGIRQNDTERWKEFHQDVDLIAKNEKYNEYERMFARRIMEGIIGYIEDISI